MASEFRIRGELQYRELTIARGEWVLTLNGTHLIATFRRPPDTSHTAGEAQFLEDMIKGELPPPFENLHFVTDDGFVMNAVFHGMGGKQSGSYFTIQIESKEWPGASPFDT